VVVFLLGLLLNLFYITVLYHRGLAHDAVVLSPRVRRFVGLTGSWVTGIDPKAWACMHRLHHRHSDGPGDPHSPVNAGVLGVFKAQLTAYEDVLRRLKRGDKELDHMMRDVDFPIHWLNRHKLWWVPHALYLGLALLLGAFHLWWLGYALFLGLMSHPIQGWMVNSFAHLYGYRNYEMPDNSRNNTFVAWTVAGEGYQNNHHRHPRSAKFSVRWWEVDPGYGLCVLAERLGWLRIDRRTLVTSLPAEVAVDAATTP
jgi:stearoyl-CoA desaturase (delta-9 desaturase)